MVTVVGLLPQRCIHGHQKGVECAVCGTVWGAPCEVMVCVHGVDGVHRGGGVWVNDMGG